MTAAVLCVDCADAQGYLLLVQLHYEVPFVFWHPWVLGPSSSAFLRWKCCTIAGKYQLFFVAERSKMRSSSGASPHQSGRVETIHVSKKFI